MANVHSTIYAARELICIEGDEGTGGSEAVEAGTHLAMSLVSASIRCTVSPCCATMVASWEKICPSSEIVDSMDSMAMARCPRY